MAYVAQTDLKGLIPDEYLTGAMDDDGSGAADANVWTGISNQVDQEIDGRLAAGFDVPLSPVPDLVKAAAKILALFFAYKRRGVSDEVNPWAKDADYWKGRLDKIGRGEDPLTHDKDSAMPPIAITEDSRTHSAAGNLMS